MSKASIQAIWGRIDAWLAYQAPEISEDLAPPASENSIRAVEDAIESELPAEFRASYLVHNGQQGAAPPLAGNWQLLSLSALVRAWRVLKDIEDSNGFDHSDVQTKGPIKRRWWHPKWIPFAYDGAGNYLCLDLAPDRRGKRGQVITYWHVSGERRIVAPGFQSWLEDVAADLEKGRISYNLN